MRRHIALRYSFDVARSQSRTKARYPAVWRAPDGPTTAGELQVEADLLRVVGRRDSSPVETTIRYDDLAGVRIGRLPQDRLNGRPTLVLERRDGTALQIEPLGAGLLTEVSDLLAALTAERQEEREQVAVIVPLKKDCCELARELVAQGPPFDPAKAGLEQHQVFVTEDEVVFVFGGAGVRRILEQVMRDPALWRASLAWRRCVAGRPRFSHAAYSWTAGS